MADISNVSNHEIKDLYESLEALSCKSLRKQSHEPTV